MQSEYIPHAVINHILMALTPDNRLACEVSLATGLRISDVLSLKTAQLKERFTVSEQKTGKNKRIFLNADLLRRLRANSGGVYAFPHRTDGKRHRTRQAVYNDLQRARKAFRIKERLTPHSCRKIYAVDKFKKFGNLKKVQDLLNHSSEAVTMIYAMADSISTNSHKKTRG